MKSLQKNNYFITGIGTQVGKTWVTCSMIKNLGYQAIKPIISGWLEQNNDTYKILDALKLEHSLVNINKISPYRFDAPLAPNMAAKLEKKEVNWPNIVGFCQKSIIANNNLLVEGVGGVMSPITDYHTNLDLIKQLDISVILVANNYLGAISHTLCAYNVLKYNDINVNHIILNEIQKNAVDIDETKRILRNHITEDIIIQPYII
jgi:dethiobiotin synthetase